MTHPRPHDWSLEALDSTHANLVLDLSALIRERRSPLFFPCVLLDYLMKKECLQNGLVSKTTDTQPCGRPTPGRSGGVASLREGTSAPARGTCLALTRAL